jgi:hypothetical protein
MLDVCLVPDDLGPGHLCSIAKTDKLKSLYQRIATSRVGENGGSWCEATVGAVVTIRPPQFLYAPQGVVRLRDHSIIL